MKNLAFSICFMLTICHVAKGQTLNLGAEEQVSLFRVKSIEDFIHRFNNDSASSFKNFILENDKNKTVTRAMSLKTCFDLSGSDYLNNPKAKEFEDLILKPESNIYLNFEDSNWYCKAKCRFKYNDEPRDITLFFKVKALKDLDTRWIIVGMEKNNVLNVSTSDSIVKTKKTVRKLIEPNSVVDGFTDLSKIFNSKLDERYCFDKEFMASENGKRLINLIKEEKLVFEYSLEETFYFLQISNYIFEVKRFIRSTNNSGLLINRVIKMQDDYKQNSYLPKLLGKK